jgi:hypothetical protein
MSNNQNVKAMNKIIQVTLLTLTFTPSLLVFSPVAQAGKNPAKTKRTTICRPVQQVRVIKDGADHPAAYRDGYREGQRSARKNDSYKPRDVGGEFARGFEDGYYDQPFAGQQYVVADRLETYTTEQCETITIHQD